MLIEKVAYNIGTKIIGNNHRKRKNSNSDKQSRREKKRFFSLIAQLPLLEEGVIDDRIRKTISPLSYAFVGLKKNVKGPRVFFFGCNYPYQGGKSVMWGGFIVTWEKGCTLNIKKNERL